LRKGQSVRGTEKSGGVLLGQPKNYNVDGKKRRRDLKG